MLLCGEKAGLAVTDVCISHSKFYPRYGFSPIQDAQLYYVHDLSFVTLTMFLSANISLSSIPQYFHSKFVAMLDEFTSNGKIVRVLN
jgi:hypothetical protein